jgi:hypothetical protein
MTRLAAADPVTAAHRTTRSASDAGPPKRLGHQIGLALETTEPSKLLDLETTEPSNDWTLETTDPSERLICQSS